MKTHSLILIFLLICLGLAACSSPTGGVSDSSPVSPTIKMTTPGTQGVSPAAPEALPTKSTTTISASQSAAANSTLTPTRSLTPIPSATRTPSNTPTITLTPTITPSDTPLPTSTPRAPTPEHYQTPTLVQPQPVLNLVELRRREVTSLIDVSPHNGLAAWSTGKQVVLWDVVNNRFRDRITPLVTVTCLRFSPDGRLLAVCAGNTLQAWWVDGGYPVTYLLIPPSGAVDAVFSADGRWMLGRRSSRMVDVIDVFHNKIARTISLPDPSLILPAFIATDGTMLEVQRYEASGTTHMEVTDPATGKVKLDLGDFSSTRYDRLVVSADGRWAALGGPEVLLLDLTGQQPAQHFPGRVVEGSGPQLAFGSGNLLAVESGAAGGGIILEQWDPALAKRVGPACELLLADVKDGLIYSPDGALLVAGGGLADGSGAMVACSARSGLRAFWQPAKDVTQEVLLPGGRFWLSADGEMLFVLEQRPLGPPLLRVYRLKG